MIFKPKYYHFICFFGTRGAAKKILLKDPKQKYTLPLIKKTIITHDVRKFRFGLPSKEHVLGENRLPVGQYIYLSVNINGHLIESAYTPVTSDDDQGYVDLLVKVHLTKVDSPHHPHLMTNHLEAMKIGDSIDFRGPNGRLKYTHPGTFLIRKRSEEISTIVKVKKVNLIAGGIGITPILQLITHIQKHENDTTKCAILLASQCEDDIVLKDQLEAIRNKDPDQFSLWYTVESPGPGWKYSKGLIDGNMLKEYLFAACNDTITLMCGSPQMIKSCMPKLEKLGHKKDLLFAY